MEEKEKSHIFIKLIVFLILLILGTFFYAKYVGVSGFIVKEYRVESNILTSNFSGMKIVHFSDLLLGSTYDLDDTLKMVEHINKLKPDLVLFTGDLVHSSKKMKEEDKNKLIEILSSINASVGKYAIYGDHDYSNNDYEVIMNKSSFKILRNSYDEVYNKTSEPLYVVGLSSSIKENVNMEESFKFYSDENRKYTIVMVHDGKSIKYLDESTYEVDLILGGHSLGGSIVIPYYGGIIIDESMYKYTSEHYNKGITDIYISSGLGTDKYPYRLFNRPSFNLYRLKAQS